MNRILFYGFVFVAMFSFTGCFDIIEEMHLKEDGSGHYSITFDMSKIMQMGFGDMLKNIGKEDENNENPDGDNIVDPSKEKAEKKSMEKDTIVYFKDMPDSIKNKIDNPAFYDKVNMHVQTSEKDKVFKMSFNLDFDNLTDIDYFYKNFDKIMASGKDKSSLGGGGKGGGMGEIGGGLLPKGNSKIFSLKKRKLERIQDKAASSNAFEDDENLAMMKMMFAGAKYTTIYHLPGKVRKASNKSAIIDGKKVTLDLPMLDYMEGKISPANTIKYKRK